MRNVWLIGLAAALCVAVVGCSDSPTSSGYGRLHLTLVDAPAAIDQVTIYVNSVEVHRADVDSSSGWITVSNDTAAYDLLELQNGVTAVLGDTMLAAGKYTQIRLHLDSATVVIDGVPYPLDIPSQTGLKLNHEFTIGVNQLTSLTLDFEVEKSIHEYTSGHYRLTPVIRVVADVTSGSISGTVTPTTAEITAMGVSDTTSAYSDSLTGAFKLMALPAGAYDVHIVPADTLYKDTTITGVAVVAKQDTDLGAIALQLK